MHPLSAINARLRDDYINDCAPVLKARNKVIAAGVALNLHCRTAHFSARWVIFRRATTLRANVDGTWQRESPITPDQRDLEYVSSLMLPCHEIGRFAQWIAPPVSGVGGKPGDFEYVRLAR
jgi:benzoyl-CoA 2,3-dioxygenase component B